MKNVINDLYTGVKLIVIQISLNQGKMMALDGSLITL